ncbi:alpha/beta hydrolase family protein [Shewanella phaeophyticola]|uniref:Alpha/beta hydrolase family protein n=1 Tax=Shewanella phaeophyticola TaxID=2978345 RepID=A0ABT2P592_9GAMM|nr:alpha/beta hydrolase family protein [Shewanella sp. KJ10-1]MCT8987789.1 alpha/beta hydrolase family protein [Shewanella sp. KJ10-1]
MQVRHVCHILIIAVGLWALIPNASAQQKYAHLNPNEIKFVTIDGKKTEILVRSWESKKQFGSMVIIGAV